MRSDESNLSYLEVNMIDSGVLLKHTRYSHPYLPLWNSMMKSIEKSVSNQSNQIKDMITVTPGRP